MKMKTFNKATFLVLALMLLFVQLSLSVVALGKPLGPEIGAGFEQDEGCGLEVCECDYYYELGDIIIMPGLELPDPEQPEEDELYPIEANSSGGNWAHNGKKLNPGDYAQAMLSGDGTLPITIAYSNGVTTYSSATGTLTYNHSTNTGTLAGTTGSVRTVGFG